MNKISRILSVKTKIACITLDFELDYGVRNRTGEFNILDNKKELSDLAELFSTLNTPVSAFIATEVLVNYPESLNLLKILAQDFHCHSHTHSGKRFDSKKEIRETALTFKKIFGYRPLGYRAPQGVLYQNDIDYINQQGFKFSSSVFPSYRPGKFNNLSMPTDPFLYDNNIMEIPLTVVPIMRYVVALSYLKLLGININKALFNAFGLPNLIIFNSHLHDYIINDKSFNRLPRWLKMAWGVNKYSGTKYFTTFVKLLKEKGYRFMTMTELYEHIRHHFC